jgi:hypothetical protein
MRVKIQYARRASEKSKKMRIFSALVRRKA